MAEPPSARTLGEQVFRIPGVISTACSAALKATVAVEGVKSRSSDKH
jgi:hypothetical protein